MCLPSEAKELPFAQERVYCGACRETLFAAQGGAGYDGCDGVLEAHLDVCLPAVVERGVVHERFLGGVGCEVLSAALGVGGVSEAYCAAYQSAGRAEGAMMAHCGVRWADLSDLATQLPEFDGLRNGHACGVGKGECENMCDESHELRYLGYLSDFAGDGLLGKGASGVDGCECERVGGECSGAIEEVPHALGHGMQGVDAQGDSELHWLAALHVFNAQSCGKKFEFVASPTGGGVDALVCEEGYVVNDEQGVQSQYGGEWQWLAALREYNAQRCCKQFEVLVHPTECDVGTLVGCKMDEEMRLGGLRGFGPEARRVREPHAKPKTSRNARRAKQRDARRAGPSEGRPSVGDSRGVGEHESGSLDALLRGLGVYAEEAVLLLSEGRGREQAPPAFMASTHEILRRVGEIAALRRA